LSSLIPHYHYLWSLNLRTVKIFPSKRHVAPRLAMSGRHLRPIRKRQLRRHILPRPTDDIAPQRGTKSLPQLRSLAPKSSCHTVSPVQHRLQLEHHNIPDEQDTEAQQDTEAPAAMATTTNIKPQHPAISQPYCPIESTCSYDVTLSSLLPINSMALSCERNQCVELAPCTNICSNRLPLTSEVGSFPELICGNQVSGVDTREIITQHILYRDLQLQETIQNRHGQDCWIPTLNAPEDGVWTVMEQPTIEVHQGQYSIHPI